MASSDLKIRQVEAFRALMQRHTVTRAAQTLHVSQPAVSRLLADFEASVGFTLFERQQGRLVPTAEARVLFEEVERAFVGMDRITLAAQQIRAMRRGTLRVVGSPAVALELLPRVVTAFVHAHPGIDVTLLTHSSTTVVELVASHRCDVGFAAEAIPHPAVRLERLTDAPMRCIVPLGHRLARKRTVQPTDLRDEAFVSFPHWFDARTAIDRLFVEHGVSRQIGGGSATVADDRLAGRQWRRRRADRPSDGRVCRWTRSSAAVFARAAGRVLSGERRRAAAIDAGGGLC